MVSPADERTRIPCCPAYRPMSLVAHLPGRRLDLGHDRGNAALVQETSICPRVAHRAPCRSSGAPSASGFMRLLTAYPGRSRRRRPSREGLLRHGDAENTLVEIGFDPGDVNVARHRQRLVKGAVTVVRAIALLFSSIGFLGPLA